MDAADGAGCSPRDGENMRHDNALSSDSALEKGLDGLLRKRRSDIMYELRQIKLGEKPVSGQDNRSRLESFFGKRPPGADGEAQSADDSEKCRPESVTIEVRGLVHTRPVTSLLQSAAFRRSLERIVRGIIPESSQRRAARDGAQATRTSTPPVASATSLEAESLRARILTSAAFPGDLERTVPDSSQRHTEQDGARTIRMATLPSFNSSTYEAEMPRAEILTPPSVNATVTRHVDQWLGEHVSSNSMREHALLEDLLEEQHHDSVVNEIGELLHRHLVSSTLRGDFRIRLESSMEERLHQAGADGRRVQQLIRSLPPSGILRNDFSNLGIAPNPVADVDDAISVMSTLTATIPFAQSNAAVVREVQTLKSQMTELRNMMKMSFDLQLDIQRSIRQEVAAALAAAITGALGNAVAPPRANVPADSSKCVICLDSGADAVLYRCGHMCTCYSCSLRLKQQGSHCPVCRAPIQDIVRAYRVE